MSTRVLLFTDDRMLTKDDGIIVHSVRFSFDGPRMLSFGRDIRFDEDNIFNNGEKISLTINGTTVFTGKLLDHDPKLDTAETIEYRAAGPRSELRGKIYTRKGSGNVSFNAETREEQRDSTVGWSYGAIGSDIANGAPNYMIASSSGMGAMTTEAEETKFAGMSYDEVLRRTVEKAGKFGFYFTPARVLKVVNLNTTTSKNVYIGEIGQKLSTHTEYDVARANLNWSISGCKTECTIEGSRARYETYITLSGVWHPSLERFWSADWVWGGWPDLDWNIYGNPADVFRKYSFTTLKRIRGDLISENKGAYTEWLTDDGKWFPFQASIDLASGEAIFPLPIYNLRRKGTTTLLERISHVYSEAKVRMKCVIEGPRIKRTVHGGNARTKGVTSNIYIMDDSLIKENVSRPGTSAIRNDLSKMSSIATALLAPVKDEEITGTVTLDGLDLTWGLENNMNIQNTKDGKWSSIKATVLAVTLNCENETTVIQVSNSQYIGAGPDYAELKRRMIVGQKIKSIEKKVSVLMNRTSPAIGNATNAAIQASGDIKGEEGATRTTGNVKEIIQQAMNDDYFTMQKHDHTDDTQGGGAYASKGASLI